ncbi:hypothetical protein FA95DRAFT_1606367 [Auriscalpium vulgare]|uniref:Uncharacterized protein n=1 Tax=Auriscalpium vulgare TaxID=40419 RepID=A0ACB8RU35_9AGAM|nr:hypothetical protein FA95DRAFT_1606367 [Auriscalpium vulgare]
MRKQQLEELEVTTPFDFPWAALPATSLLNLTVLDIRHNAGALKMSRVVDVAAALQSTTRLTQLSLGALDIQSDPPGIRGNQIATLRLLKSFTLDSTISGAYILLRHLLIPFDTSTDISVCHRGEDSQAILGLFHQAHVSAALDAVLRADPVRKPEMPRKMMINHRKVEIHTSLRGNGPANLILRLERDRHGREDDLLWCRHAVYDATISLCAFEKLHAVEVEGRPAVVEFCAMLGASMVVVTGLETSANVKEIPYHGLTSLTLSSIDLESPWNTTTTVGDTLVILIRMLGEERVQFCELVLRNSKVSKGLLKRLQEEAGGKMILSIEDQIL